MRQREAGVDLLRALCALLVVAIHLFPLTAQVNREPAVSTLPVLLGYALSLCAVNGFGLISGYVGYREEPGPVRISALLLIWLQMVLYRVLFLLLPWRLGLSGQAVAAADIFLPVTRRVNWYITAYMETMLIAPAIHTVVRNSSPRSNAGMMLALFAFTSLAPLLRAVMDCDPFQLQEGYSWIWLSVLYFWGCSLKKHGWFRRTPSRRLWAVLAASLLLTALWRYAASAFAAPGSFLNLRARLFYGYTSPTLVLASGCLLLLCARLRPSAALRRIIAPAARASLGVFLLHTTVWYWLIEPQIARLPLPPQPLGCLRTFCAAVMIALPCALIDLGRDRLFDALGLRRLTDRVQRLALSLFSRLSGRLLRQ